MTVSETSAIRIDGKVAIITGAGRGQGAATAALFVAAGATVFATDIDEAEGEAAAKEAGGDVPAPRRIERGRPGLRSSSTSSARRDASTCWSTTPASSTGSR